MKFGRVPVAEAVGALLAHSITVGGAIWRKGRVLDEADIAALTTAGMTEVIVARLGLDDVPEDAAATRLARALVPDEQAAGLRLAPAHTGRVNIHATGPGILGIDRAAIDALNAADPLLSVATLAPSAPLAEGTLAATVKIIAYAVPDDTLTRAENAGRAGLRRHAPVITRATLIQTDIGGGPGKGEDPIRQRLARFGVSLDVAPLVPHEAAALATAIAQTETDLILILTASATSDPADVTPTAIRAAGGAVERFGMPVDPGNLLVLGHLGPTPIIGLPGCARSPALNGADWVLNRVICGQPVTSEDIAGMGVGGLLKESPARPHPRERG